MGKTQMRVGFDVTALYVAQAGIFYYDYNLIRALLEVDTENEYLLLDYRPIHGGYTAPSALKALEQSRAGVTHVKGLRHRKLARLQLLQRPVLWSAAKFIDRTLFFPWAAMAEKVMKRNLAPVLESLDVFHSSEVVLWYQPGAYNVVTIYDLSALLFPAYHTEETLEIQREKYQFAQEKADMVIAISESTRRDVIEYLDIPPERVRVVYAGVNPIFRPVKDLESLRRELESWHLVPDDYIFYLGTLEPRKNLVRLVEAYSGVRRRVGKHCPPLVLAGAVGWGFEEIFSRIEDLDLKNSVRYLGRPPLEALPILYSGARLFVYPSLYEGFGMPPLEAMACGTPVVTSNTSSLPEVVGDAGEVVSPDDTLALAEGMISLIGDAVKRQTLQKAGLERKARFSWEKSAKQILSLYAAGRQ